MWFARFKNVLKDVDQQVKYTRNEEALHALAGIRLIGDIRKEHPELFDEELEQRIYHEAQEALKAESKIIDWMVNGYNEENLNAPLLKELIKQRLNTSLEQIDFKPIFEVKEGTDEKVLWFNEDLLGNGMTDFFSSRPIEYSKNSQSFSEEDLF
jgi:ribonucleoside-diphosphate reductase beta chain